MALFIPQGEALSFWPWPRPISHPWPKPKPIKPIVSAECIKAKLEVATCVKEKLVSPWFPEPLVDDCCHPIADLKKNCPARIAKFDERFIPPFIKDVCSAPGPSAPGPSA